MEVKAQSLSTGPTHGIPTVTERSGKSKELRLVLIQAMAGGGNPKNVNARDTQSCNFVQLLFM